MKCFLCTLVFEENDEYFKHLKCYHLLKHNDNYICCGTIYKDGSSFKRHMKVKHTPANVSSDSSITVLAEESEQAFTDKYVQEKEHCSTENINRIAKQLNLSEISENLIKYETNMYSKFNFCQSDVERANANLLTIIIEPLLEQFRLLGEQFDKESYLQICNFTVDCLQIFQSLKSEHLLRKKLMDKELLVELEEAVVDVEGTLAHKNDEESMDELLRNWNLHHLKDFFKDEAITTDVLKLMTYGDLQELLQKLKFGERVIFRSSYEKWKADHNITIFSQTMPIGSRCFSSSPTLSILSQSSECFSEKSQIKVINILKQHNIGCRIIDNYEHTKKLTEEHRNSLLNIINEYFDSRAIPMTLQTTHRLENEIIDCFPTEKIEFYRNDKRGKLYIKYHNKKRILKSLENTESSKETGNDKENVHNLLISEPEGHVLAQSLKFDNLSVEEFSATWAACAKYRLNQIMKESKSITQILKMWPQYKGSNGFKLIDHDFSVIHSTASTMLQWDAKWEKICDYLTTRQNICDKKVKEVVLFLKNNWTEEGKDNFCLQMLWCIHYFLYSTKKYVRRTVDGKKETARYSLRDSQESFVFIGSTMQELEERMEFLQSKGEPIQPFILGVGDPKAINVTECFVYLDTHLLKVNSFCRALDICFKCHHIFNVEYSQSSMPFWIFVEKYLYGISTGKNNISKLSILLNEISNIL